MHECTILIKWVMSSEGQSEWQSEGVWVGLHFIKLFLHPNYFTFVLLTFYVKLLPNYRIAHLLSFSKQTKLSSSHTFTCPFYFSPAIHQTLLNYTQCWTNYFQLVSLSLLHLPLQKPFTIYFHIVHLSFPVLSFSVKCNYFFFFFIEKPTQSNVYPNTVVV